MVLIDEILTVKERLINAISESDKKVTQLKREKSILKKKLKSINKKVNDIDDMMQQFHQRGDYESMQNLMDIGEKAQALSDNYTYQLEDVEYAIRTYAMGAHSDIQTLKDVLKVEQNIELFDEDETLDAALAIMEINPVADRIEKPRQKKHYPHRRARKE